MRLRAKSKPKWDPVQKRWWISIKAKKNIKPGAEITIPYGQAHKGLPKAQWKVKPMMMHVTAMKRGG